MNKKKNQNNNSIEMIEKSDPKGFDKMIKKILKDVLK